MLHIHPILVSSMLLLGSSYGHPNLCTLKMKTNIIKNVNSNCDMVKCIRSWHRFNTFIVQFIQGNSKQQMKQW